MTAYISAAALFLCALSADAMKLYSPPSWSLRTAMPYAASDFTATPLGGKIYIVGGCNGNQTWEGAFDFPGYYCSSVTAETLVYDPSTDTFEALAAAPRPRYRHAAVALGTEIIVLGGKTLFDDTLAEVDVLDTVTGTWSTRGAMSAPAADLAAFTLGGVVYAVGGYSAIYDALSVMSVMDPSTGVWSTLDARSWLNTERGDHGIGIIDGQVYAFGGFTHLNGFSAPHASLEALDADTMTWVQHPEPATIGRGDKAVVGLHGRVLVLGGEAKDGEGSSLPLQDVEAFHPFTSPSSAGGWSFVGTLMEKRFRFSAAAVGDSVYVFGGQGYLVGEINAEGSYYPVVSAVSSLTEEFLDTDTLVEEEEEDDMVTAGLVCGVLGFLLGAIALLVSVTKRANSGKNTTTDANVYDKHVATV